jgi:tetratricopeptide (TPR) repeat protein
MARLTGIKRQWDGSMPYSRNANWMVWAVLGVIGAPCPLEAAEPNLKIRSDFAGGNVVVVRNEGSTVHLTPDMRGGKPWFYWHFEATASEAGNARFVFAGSPMIGVNGAAVSNDGGKTWQWQTSRSVAYADPKLPRAEQSESFQYRFKKGETARFAVAIPYLPADLDAFLATLAGNPHFKKSYLTKTRSGTPVELLEIGRSGEGRKSMLVTARHHACESIASYALEGLVREAASESTAGRAFREKYHLLVVPMVDKDGVAAGDQGKNRSPHDHNRDYGDAPIFPEIAAIQELAKAYDIRYTLDLHCPALRGDVHEVFHFLGLGLPRVKNNVDEFIGRIREERPPVLNAPLSFLADSSKPGAINRAISSHYFATSEENVFAATLEIPYAVPSHELDADSARAYGAALLRAWTATTFVPHESVVRSREESSAELLAVRTEFGRSYRGKPDAMLKMIDELPKTPPYRVEARVLRAAVLLHQKQFSAADQECDQALADGGATMVQTVTARMTRLRIAAADPKTNGELVSRRLNEILAIRYLANDQQSLALASAGEYFAAKGDHEGALKLAERQLPVVADYEHGKLLLRMASLLEASGNSEGAARYVQQAVNVLQEQLRPKPPRSGFGAAMTVDLFDALGRLRSATLDEKRAAAKQVLEHDVVPVATKERIRQALGELEKP